MSPRKKVVQAYKSIQRLPTEDNPYPSVAFGAEALSQGENGWDAPVATAAGREGEEAVIAEAIARDRWGNQVYGDVGRPDLGMVVEGRRYGVIPTDSPRFDDAPVSPINFAVPDFSPVRVSHPPGPRTYSVERQIPGRPGRHTFEVIADPRTGEIQELDGYPGQLSYGPSTTAFDPKAKLVRMPPGSRIFEEDLAAFPQRNQWDSPWRVSITEIPVGPRSVLSSAKEVDAEIGTLTHPGSTPYSFWPLEGVSGANSNSAESALKNGAIQRERPGSPLMRPPSSTGRAGFGLAPGWEHPIQGRDPRFNEGRLRFRR